MIARNFFPWSEAPDAPRASDAPEAAAPASAAATPSSRRALRWAGAVSLLPIPLWFAASALLAPEPAWRAEYRESAAFAGPGVVIHERQLQRYWDKSNPKVPGGLSYKRFAARWDACLTTNEARDVPFMLAADGTARFALDGVERLRAQSTSTIRVTRGDTIRLEPGIHHLHVELEPRGWPSVALLASLDGDVPRAIDSGELVTGIRVTPPSEGPVPCPAR